MKLHTIGDCHADTAWYNIEVSDTQFEEINWNGNFGFTMSGFGTRKLDGVNISTFYKRVGYVPKRDPKEEFKKYGPCPYDHYFNIDDGDAVVFCFGEIECRLAFSSPLYSNTWQEMADTAVPLYFDAIKLNVEKFSHLHTMVFNINPTTRNKDIPTYPVESGEEIRRSTILYVNRKLKEYCEKYNYIFFDVYDKYCDNEGYLNLKFSDGSNHVINPIYYVEFLNNLKFEENKTNHKKQKVLKSAPIFVPEPIQLFVPEPIQEPLSKETYTDHQDIFIPTKTFLRNVRNSNKYLKSRHIEYRDVKH